MSSQKTGKTAILVIHGVGPHKPYDACDTFTQGFLEEYRKKHSNIQLQHLIKPRKDYQQHCISIQSSASGERIDCYEYFWDIYMVHKVLPNESWDLLVKASNNAKKYYDNILKDTEAVAKLTDLEELTESPLFRKRRTKKNEKGKYEFKPNGYLRLIGGGTVFIVKVLPYIPWMVKALEYLSSLEIPVFTPVFKFVSSLFKKLSGSFQNQVEKNFMGDLVRYLDMDPRSTHHDTRQKILNGAVEEVRALVEDDYDRIIIAGHSLGSVIALDTVDRLIQHVNAGRISRENAEKITGLVTFGSPIDKIAFFFREYIEPEKQIQRKIITDIHTFRSRSLLSLTEEIKDPDPFYILPEVRWLNFWHPKDLISGKLDLYDLSIVPPRHAGTRNADGTLDGNIRITMEGKFLSAHGCYWGRRGGKGTGQMYEALIQEFFSGD